MIKLLLFALLSTFPLIGESSYESNRLLFLITQGKIEEAISLYQSIAELSGKHNLELLKDISLLILEQGIKSKDPEETVMSLFGISIAMNDKATFLLEDALNSPLPQIQLIALNFLARSQNDGAYEKIQKLISSPFLPIRLEAIHQLALVKHPRATAQIEALMQKMDTALLPIFPELFSLVGDHAALRIMRKLLNHKDPDVRTSTILSATKAGQDELLASIRRLAAQHDPRQQEAAAYSLGVFKDHNSIEILKKLSTSLHPTVKVAALQALYNLGIETAAKELTFLALQGDLFAIQSLKDIPHSEEMLVKIMENSAGPIRLNATLALFAFKDARSLPGIAEILIRDRQTIAYTEVISPGKALIAWKEIPSLAYQEEQIPLLEELSLSFRESILEKAIELPEDNFLKLAKVLFETKQNELIPLLTRLLVNLESEKSIQLLKKEAQKLGAPLIRNYCTLALAKMEVDDSYLESLKQWTLKQQEVDMLKFRTYVPFDLRISRDTYELTPQESAKLLVEAFEVLSEKEQEKSLDLFLRVLKEGHKKNRFVIAGFILKSVQ